jgi:hypothetical protein
MTSPPISEWIVINPDPGRDKWQFSLFGPACRFACGDALGCQRMLKVVLARAARTSSRSV